jgi:hypothetical protein
MEGADLVLQMDYCETFRWLHGCFAIPRKAYRRLNGASTEQLPSSINELAQIKASERPWVWKNNPKASAHFALKKALHVLRENFLNVFSANLRAEVVSLICINDGIGSDPWTPSKAALTFATKQCCAAVSDHLRWGVGSMDTAAVDRVMASYEQFPALERLGREEIRVKVSQYLEKLSSAGHNEAEDLTFYGLAYLRILHEGPDPRYTGC